MTESPLVRPLKLPPAGSRSIPSQRPLSARQAPGAEYGELSTARAAASAASARALWWRRKQPQSGKVVYVGQCGDCFAEQEFAPSAHEPVPGTRCAPSRMAAPDF